MKIYHGINATNVQDVLKNGLKPRALTKNSNWVECPSHPWMVYLSEAYAPYFAISCLGLNETEIGIVEIELDLLQNRWFRPDEDFIEQSTRSRKDLGIKGKTMLERTQWIRKNIDHFTSNWKLSLEHIGNMAHKGIIPAHAISKVSVVNLKGIPQLALMMLDPTITIQNYALCGDKYRNLTQWCVGKQFTAKEFLGQQFEHVVIMNPELAGQQEKAFNEILLKQKDCVTIAYAKNTH